MDPDECLKQLLEQKEVLKNALNQIDDNGGETPALTEELYTSADRLVDLLESLDGWLEHGGFIPRRWDGTPK